MNETKLPTLWRVYMYDNYARRDYGQCFDVSEHATDLEARTYVENTIRTADCHAIVQRVSRVAITQDFGWRSCEETETNIVKGTYTTKQRWH